MQPQTTTDQDKMVPIDTSGESVDIEVKDEENKNETLEDKEQVEEQVEQQVQLEDQEEAKEVHTILKVEDSPLGGESILNTEDREFKNIIAAGLNK